MYINGWDDVRLGWSLCIRSNSLRHITQTKTQKDQDKRKWTCTYEDITKWNNHKNGHKVGAWVHP